MGVEEGIRWISGNGKKPNKYNVKRESCSDYINIRITDFRAKIITKNIKKVIS